MESRKRSPLKSSDLPVDFLKMVGEVFATNFDEGLKAFEKVTGGAASSFKAGGQIFADEIVLTVSLLTENQIAATTAYASIDFDPKASSPTLQDQLAFCVDALGGLFSVLMDPGKPEELEKLANESLSALEDVPYDWTPVDVEKRKVYLKLDKSNPVLEQAADDWLAKNDPDYKKRLKEEQSETEKLFVTGPKKGDRVH